jgi:hypothetical protein
VIRKVEITHPTLDLDETTAPVRSIEGEAQGRRERMRSAMALMKAGVRWERGAPIA